MPDLLDRAARVGEALLDLIYPPRCPGCGRVGFVFCDKCRARVQHIVPPVCLRCGAPLPREGLCSRCRPIPSELDRITAVAVFSGTVRQAIHALKFQNNTTLAAPLGELMYETWHSNGYPAPDLIVPVPLHGRRQAERGYNQSILLARVISRSLGVPVDDHTLVRSRATPPQVGLAKAERRQNVDGAFVCRRTLEGKKALVVDDVCTTGATLEGCAAALKAAGATTVWALTLARAPVGSGRDEFVTHTYNGFRTRRQETDTDRDLCR